MWGLTVSERSYWSDTALNTPHQSRIGSEEPILASFSRGRSLCRVFFVFRDVFTHADREVWVSIYHLSFIIYHFFCTCSQSSA